MRFLIRPLAVDKVFSGCSRQCDQCGNECFGRFRSPKGMLIVGKTIMGCGLQSGRA